MRFTIDIDDARLDGLRAIDPAVSVADGDDESGEWQSRGELLIVDAELQMICRISKRDWEDRAPLLAGVIASFLDQAGSKI